MSDEDCHQLMLSSLSLRINNQERWNILPQITQDMNQLRELRGIIVQNSFYNNLDSSLRPFLIPNTKSLFNRGVGFNRSSDLQKLTESEIHNHCVDRLHLITNYQTEYEILSQLQLDFSFCIKRGFSFHSEPYFRKPLIGNA